MYSFGEKCARYGVLSSFLSVLLGRLRKHLRIEIWSIQTRPLDANFEIPREHQNRFVFKSLTLKEAIAASGEPELLLSHQTIHEAFERGDLCMGAYDGQRLVAYVWRSLKSAPAKENLWLNILDQRFRYGYKSLVLPAYRGIRLNKSVGRFYDHHFVERGIAFDIGFVALDNLASMKSNLRDPQRRKLGYVLVMERSGKFATFRTKKVRTLLSFTVKPLSH